MKIRLAYSELRALLAPVIPHAGTDDMLPAICQVPVAETDGWLVAQATDRFTAAFKRVKPVDPPTAGFAMQLETSDARRLLALFKPSRGQDPVIDIETTDTGEIQFHGRAAGFALGFVGLDVEVASPSIIGKGSGFPDLASLLPTDLTEPSVDEQGFNVRLLTRFAAAIDGREPTVIIRMASKANRPLVVTTGDPDFVGLIMPRRTPDAVSVVDTVTSWRGQIPRNGIKAVTAAPTKEAGYTPGSVALEPAVGGSA